MGANNDEQEGIGRGPSSRGRLWEALGRWNPVAALDRKFQTRQEVAIRAEPLQGDVGPSTAEAAEEIAAERREHRRFQLLFAAEVATRYHRRRATFLSNVDVATNALTLFAGASALGGALGVLGKPWLVGMTAFVSLVSIIKIVTRIGASANAHTGWFRRWSTLLEDIEVTERPDDTTLAKWARTRHEIERECVGELRALCIDCENVAARVLRVPGRQRKIKRWQRWLVHFGTLQAEFPFDDDPRALPTEPQFQ